MENSHPRLPDIFSNPRAMLFCFGALSALALGIVYVAQYGFGYAPCELCIYQRIPHVVIVALSIIGLALIGRSGRAGRVSLTLICLSYAANAIIAAYHSGVERKYWASFLEGCTIPEISGDPSSMLAQIQAAPVVRCDEIPWTDPVLALSMANYNLVFCLILAIAAFICAKRCYRQAPSIIAKP